MDRRDLLRIAHQHPETRKHLLPLLLKTSSKTQSFQDRCHEFMEELLEELQSHWKAKKTKIIKEVPLESWHLGLLLDPALEIFDRQLQIQREGKYFLYTVTSHAGGFGSRPIIQKLAQDSFYIEHSPAQAALIIANKVSVVDYNPY